MNYDKLKRVITANGLSILKASVAIKRTEGWFHNAVRNDTMTIADLEKILTLCNSSTSEFFAGEPANVVSEPQEPYGNNEVTELLRENRILRIKIEELEGRKNR